MDHVSESVRATEGPMLRRAEIGAPPPVPVDGGRTPSLDGLRAISIGLVAGLYPSLSASRLEPVEALRS